MQHKGVSTLAGHWTHEEVDAQKNGGAVATRSSIGDFRQESGHDGVSEDVSFGVATVA